MNVFILSTGRCGSMTIAKAFDHAENYTASHETQSSTYYNLNYPDQWIESDNRLSWMLGALGAKYPEAKYIHLIRDREEMARSFAVRPDSPGASIRGFGAGILGLGEQFPLARYECAARMWDIVNANIIDFLNDSYRPSRQVWLHELTEKFPELWDFIGAEGDLESAPGETEIKHNASLPLVWGDPVVG